MTDAASRHRRRSARTRLPFCPSVLVWLVCMVAGGSAAAGGAAQGVAAGGREPESQQGAVVPAGGTQPAAAAEPEDGVAVLLEKLRAALERGAVDEYLALLAEGADRDRARTFAEQAMLPGVTRVMLRERDRALMLNGGYSLTVDAFIETGRRGRIHTWQLDVKAGAITDPLTANEWRILSQEPLTVVDGLYRLSLNVQKQYIVRNLTVKSDDYSLTLPLGTAFIAETDEGVTAAVLIGRGELSFAPSPEAERIQVRLFCGESELRTAFDSAFIRFNPGDRELKLSPSALTEGPVQARDLRRAEQIFNDEMPKSFGLDLSDLSRERWSLTPPFGDFLAEVRTRKYKTLTYAKSSGEPEDITLFSRETKRNISIYASNQRIAARGRFYSEDAQADYDIEHYDIEAEIDPQRLWVEGTARVRLRSKVFALGTLTLKLAEPLGIRSVRSDKHGRVLSVRVLEQNSIILNLPKALEKDATATLTIAYGGRLEPPPADREVIAPQDPVYLGEVPTLQPEFRVVYSNRSYWYPQGTVPDYATAVLKLTVPAEFDAVASGSPANGNPVNLPETAAHKARKLFVFAANQPVRYLSTAVSKLQHVASGELERTSSAAPREVDSSEAKAAVDDGAPEGGGPQGNGSAGPQSTLVGNVYRTATLSVVSNPRQISRGEEFKTRVAAILGFYADLVDDLPYPSFTLALVDNELPGGHSPGYFALLHQPLPTTPYIWRNDPVVFEGFPDFFLAHETAHQFWGQAVGWKNYHEQWISEGFAQYFAALYAERARPGSFPEIVRQMRRTALANRSQGPIHLGYRLGHVRGESRVFRALVYNKSALVLHMLRRYMGDDVFFRGLRRFYREFRFKKAGTDDVRQAFEAESGLGLVRFFDRWIMEGGIPEIFFSYVEEPASATAAGCAQPGAPEGPTVVLRFEQRGELIYDVPVTVTLRYQSGETDEVVAKLTDRITEVRVPARSSVRDIRVNEDNAALVEIKR